MITAYTSFPIVYLRGHYEFDRDVGNFGLKRTPLTVQPGDALAAAARIKGLMRRPEPMSKERSAEDPANGSCCGPKTEFNGNLRV
jgi:hypothetical protein